MNGEGLAVTLGMLLTWGLLLGLAWFAFGDRIRHFMASRQKVRTTGEASQRSSQARRKASLVARINRSGDVNDPGTPRPLVTLEEFFEDNDDPGSIGSNLPAGVEPQEFYEILMRVRSRDEVTDVLVEISTHDDPEQWPFLETIWIITSASAEAVSSWFPTRLRPDTCFSGFPTDRQMEECAVPPGMTAVGAWYD